MYKESVEKDTAFTKDKDSVFNMMSESDFKDYKSKYHQIFENSQSQKNHNNSPQKSYQTSIKKILEYIKSLREIAPQPSSVDYLDKFEDKKNFFLNFKYLISEIDRIPKEIYNSLSNEKNLLNDVERAEYQQKKELIAPQVLSFEDIPKIIVDKSYLDKLIEYCKSDISSSDLETDISRSPNLSKNYKRILINFSKTLNQEDRKNITKQKLEHLFENFKNEQANQEIASKAKELDLPPKAIYHIIDLKIKQTKINLINEYIRKLLKSKSNVVTRYQNNNFLSDQAFWEVQKKLIDEINRFVKDVCEKYYEKR